MENKIIVLFLLFAIVACNHLEKGEVISKRHEPENTFVMIMPIRVGKTTMMIPYIIHDNEDWVITVKGKYEGDDETDEVYVFESCFNSLKNGDTWVKSQGCSYSDNNNEKTRK